MHNRAACLWILSTVLSYFDCADPMLPRHIIILIDGFNRKSIVFFLVDSVVMKSKTRGQDYKEKHKLDSKQISNSPC